MGYEVIGRLARGGMGVVDLAVDDDGNEVAVKRLSLYGSADDMTRARRRIRREAEVLAALHHPGIVTLLDVVDDCDDLVLVMPYLRGGTLADHVARHGPLGPDQSLALLDALLDALAAAHRQGVVHRDLKPANVLLDDTGRPQLADFGVAWSRDATPGLTATDLVVGTPGFMAPEQARGEPPSAASDVFSLCATIAFAATGTPPFGMGDPRVLMHRAATGKLARLPRTVPVELRRRLAPLLEPNPLRRPTAAAARGGPAGTIVRPVLAGARRRMRRPAVAAAASAGVLVLALGGWAIGSRVGGDEGSGTDAEGAPASDCQPLPYQPCGSGPAPGTDGRQCIDDRDDYDGDAGNGCEAVPDDRDGEVLVDRLEANLVPADDVDTYPFEVEDRAQLICDGTVTISLTAPVGVGQRLEVLDADGEVLGDVVSFDGEPRSVEVTEPSCGGDDSTTLEARVSPVAGGRSAEPYTLEVTGSF
ncbi:hypothetical protein BH24ACT3_BH24ACT3_07890 [soil metagenome]